MALVSSPGVMDLLCLGLTSVSHSRSSRDSMEDFR